MTTRWAYASMTATSSAVADRTAPPSVPAVAAASVALIWPKAPKSTLAIERFIARHISIVSSVPEAPTSIPLTIKTLFWSSKPAAAAPSEYAPRAAAPAGGRSQQSPDRPGAQPERAEHPLVLVARHDRDSGRD